MPIITPPSRETAPLVHTVCEFYKLIYAETNKVPKRDRFGIFAKIETVSLMLVELVITATFESKNQKLPSLNTARIKIELLKRLLRIANELNIIEQKKYIYLESQLQEISKMTNGWIKYLEQNQ